MPVTVLEWKPNPPVDLPEPLLSDDSDQFPPEVVRVVRDWLLATKPMAEHTGPTPQTITPMGVIVGGKKNPVIVQGNFTFDHYTVEVNLRHKQHKLALSYRYCSARERQSGLIILGPRLKAVQRARVQ